MAKIHVFVACNQLGIGGTEKTLQIFYKHLERSRLKCLHAGRAMR